MINLIPKEEKKKIINASLYKLIVLLFFVAGFSLFILSFAIIPSYFISLEKENIVSLKLEQQKNELIPSPDQKTLASIKDVNNKLNLIEKAEQNKFTISVKVINAIMLNKTPNIKITEISFKNGLQGNPLQDTKISIQGSAPSREVLLSFRRALESSPNFKQVDLPISNFIKGSNIKFYLSLIPS